MHDAVGDHTGVGDADLVGPAELADHGGHGLADGFRRGRLRCLELEAVTDQQPGVEVDDAALDAASADVDAEAAALAASAFGRAGESVAVIGAPLLQPGSAMRHTP